MESSTIWLVLLPIFAWGTASVIDKFAVNSIGPKAAFIVYLTASAVTFSYFLFSGGLTPLKVNGVVFAIVGGIFTALGAIGWYLAMQKEQVSLVTPFAALYPAVTVILGFILLHEKIKLVNATGVVLALIAGVLLAL